MKFISHRGNLYGADPEKENDPRYIEKAMLHCDVEVDLFFAHEVAIKTPIIAKPESLIGNNLIFLIYINK